MNLRKDDVTDVLNAMSVWNSDKKGPFYGRLDTKNIGIAGHSMERLHLWTRRVAFKS